MEVGIQLLEEVGIQLVGIPGQEVEVGRRLDVPAVVVQIHKVVVAVVVVPPFAEQLAAYMDCRKGQCLGSHLSHPAAPCAESACIHTQCTT